MKLLIDIPEHIYEHAKEESEDSRDEFEAMRAIANGTQQESSSEIPNTCGDAISRQAVLDIIAFEDKWLFDANGHNANTHIAFSGLESRVKALPSVSPQQRTGRWEWVQYDYNPKLGNWHCSECWSVVMECVDKNEKSYIPLYKYCPQCGCKMEVEE